MKIKVIAGRVTDLIVAKDYENVLCNASEASLIGFGSTAVAVLGDGLSATTLASANNDAAIKMDFFKCVVNGTALEGHFYKIEFQNGQYIDFAVEEKFGNLNVRGARDPIQRLVWMLPHKSKGHLAQRRSNFIGVLLISIGAAVIFFCLGYFLGDESRDFRLSRAKAMAIISFAMTLVVSFSVCKRIYRNAIDTTGIFEAFGFSDPPNVNLPRGNSRAEKRYAAETGKKPEWFAHCRYRYDESDIISSEKTNDL